MKLNLKANIIEELALDDFYKSEHLKSLEAIGRPDDYKERKKLAIDLALARNASHEANNKLSSTIYN